MDTNSYLSYAESDFNFFKAAVKSGMIYNAMPAIAQNSCEKYLKDLVERFFVPENQDELIDKTKIMRTHSLSKLLKFIENDMGITITDDAKDAIEGADGYYFTTRYPGDNSIEVDSRDIRKCEKALNLTKQLHREIETLYLKQFEQEADINNSNDRDDQ